VSVSPEKEGALRERAGRRGVPLRKMGVVRGHRLVVDGLINASVDEMAAVWRNALPRLLLPGS